MTEERSTVWTELVELFDHRSLVWTMVVRELKIRYAQTIFGMFWAFLKPLTYLAIYTYFFTVLMPMEGLGAPYPLVALCGVMAWMLFMDVVNSSGESIINDAQILKASYIPLLVPIVYKGLLGVVEFMFSLIIFFIIQAVLGFPFRLTVLLIPFILIINLLVGLSVSIWTNVLGVKIRDFYHLIQTLIGFGFWLTPVFYVPELLPENLRFLVYLNPMAGVIALYRWTMLGLEMPSPYYALGLISSFLMLFLGLAKLKNAKKHILDYL